FNVRHTLLARAERVEKDELIEGHHHDETPAPGHADTAPVFGVGKVSAGYIYDFLVEESRRLGAGVLVSQTFLPAELESVYDGDPAAFSVFLRGQF
ncbi:MAG TPA: hypothetical protein VF254_03070, partial [Gammaproteobacteria bacterium]